jgi:5-hydroxyisourate hydrolase-like protein (transthyretin family)
MGNDNDSESDQSDGGGKGRGSGKSRRELPTGAVSTLKAWLLSPEHFTHPYPTPQDQVMLMQTTGIDKKQLKNWFTNARRRIWKPMLKKQLEQGQLVATSTGGVAAPAIVPGLRAHPGAPAENASVDVQGIQTNVQAVQANDQTQTQVQQQDSVGRYCQVAIR